MVVAALRRIIRAVDLRSRVLVTRYGLTGPQLTVMKELAMHGGGSVSELTRVVSLSQATVTGILDRLTRRGLVRRERSNTDRRRVLVWLTEAGQRLLVDAPPLLQEEFTTEFNKLNSWEQTQILYCLQRLGSMMETRRVEAAPVLAAGPADDAPDRMPAIIGQHPAGDGAAEQ